MTADYFLQKMHCEDENDQMFRFRGNPFSQDVGGAPIEFDSDAVQMPKDLLLKCDLSTMRTS